VQRTDIIFLTALGVLVFASGLGLRDPWPADEPRFALIARDMVETGKWFFPRRGGELYPDKPPLFMWAIASFYWMTGSIRFSFLLPSILSGLGTTFLVYDLGRRLWQRRIGLYAALILFAILQFPLKVKSAQIDASLCVLTTLGLYGLLRHLLRGPAWPWYYAGCFAMGLGVITKGVGFLPLFIFLPYFFCRWKSWRLLPTFRASWTQWALGPAFLLAAISLWLVPMILLVAQRQDPGLTAYQNNILWHQTADRYAASWGHIKPFWYFIIAVVPWAWFPLNLAFPWTVPAWWRRIRRKDSRQLMLLAWVALVLLFFSLSPGKRGIYILPAAPALALATAPLMPGLIRHKALQKAAWVLTSGLGGIFLLLSFIGVFFKTPLSEKLHALGVQPWGLLCLIGLIGTLFSFWSGKNQGVKALSLFFFALWLMYGWVGYPLFNPIRSPAALMADVGRRIGPEGRLAIVRFKEQLLLHADRPVVHFGYHQKSESQEIEAARWLREQSQGWVLLPEKNLSRCFLHEKAAYVGRRHGIDWFLVNRESLRDACYQSPEPVRRFSREG